MVTHYRQQMERLEHHISALRACYTSLKTDYAFLQISFERMENYAAEQEARADALHQVIDGFINRSDAYARRDLMDEFNAVAEELQIPLEQVIADWEIETLLDSDDDVENINV